MKIQVHNTSFAKLILRSALRVGIGIVAICVIAGLCVAYSFFIEPQWLTIKSVTLSESPTVTLIHISDTHYKGNRKYLTRVVETINKLDADFVCFTGDLVEEKKYLPECMALLSTINKPLYGIPGNHDQWARVSKADLSDYFETTGGKWLENKSVTIMDNTVVLIGGRHSSESQDVRSGDPDQKHILLNHYPSIVNSLPSNSYDLILTGHTHGGQVRLPFIKNPILKESDAIYDRGLFHTEAGILYVNSGIGTYLWPVRFRCRPEITIIKL